MHRHHITSATAWVLVVAVRLSLHSFTHASPLQLLQITEHPKLILEGNDVLSIGRRKDNHLVLQGTNFSGKHCEIFRNQQGDVIIRDNKSTKEKYQTPTRKTTNA